MFEDFTKIETINKSESFEDSLNKDIEDLQKNNQILKKQNEEERFLFFIILMIFFDVLFLEKTQNWSTSIIIGLLELIIVLALSRKYNISDVIELLDRVTKMLSKSNNP